ncbi:ATP-dependent DNA helicase RecG [Kineococcus xinjiangensis]|uniref:Probable DNA 3'-5' helicase RecG n=1 Tax=Kineococcus xinjiangensis TaxID=512762 RepID=A0A2S6IW14_9ACTN|nr:ATP-dependent DNA helicase RecG [Kineococcus xinjiangensis]PPK98549.1 ATP-dependent DNA helicase RecG [Kineococcus xinjiangensis]
MAAAGTGALVEDLDAPLSARVGGTTAAKLEAELDLRTVRDLLWHLPRRYAERGQLTPVSSLAEGDDVTVVAQVQRVSGPRQMKSRRGAMLEVWVGDGRTELLLTFFAKGLGPLNHHARQLPVGTRALFAGKVQTYRRGAQRVLQLVHPEHRPLPEDAPDAVGEQFAAQPMPIYPATAKVRSWDVAAALSVVLTSLGDVDDAVPPGIAEREGLPSAADALRWVHQPRTKEEWQRGLERFRYEEAFVLQASLAQRRHAAARETATPRPARLDGLLAALDARLPFELTAGQRGVGEAIAADLAATSPMQRLLQGEVGSGKTLVALRAMLTVVDAGGQAALLAPTEVLAGQHLRSITAMLGDLALGGQLGAAEQATQVVLLTGSMPAAARRRALLAAASGEAGIVIGTHALLEEHVQFADLGLVVVDEQHRFGVEQRDALRSKAATSPHVLVMTATPIPRTVAMTVFGDLETSTLRELPPGRAPISTHVVPLAQRPEWIDRVFARIAEEAADGHQVYVVCPRIGGEDAPAAPGEDGKRPPLAVEDVVAQVRAHPATAALRTEVLHGRLATEEKEDVVRRFAARELDVVVATTVVEVGVDVPTATLMVIMDAERFGISQLHQLRGRVGRGGLPGTCLLVTEAAGASRVVERLRAVEATTDGFELARVDLEQRREGDVLGAAQSGRRSSLRVLSVLDDVDLITRARADATAVVAQDPELRGHPGLAAAIADRVGAEQRRFLERA